MKKRLLRKRIQTGGVYLGLDTLRGRKFPHGNFRTSVFCVRQNTDCRKNEVFRQSQAPPYRRGLDLCSFSTAFYPPRPMGENTVYIAASRNGAMTMDARQSTMPRLKYFGMKNSAISVSRRRRMRLAYVRRVRKIKSAGRSCIAFGIPDMQKNVEHNVMPQHTKERSKYLSFL